MSCPYFCRYGADWMDFRLRGIEGLNIAYFFIGQWISTSALPM